jgi:hypothetical protein
MADRKLWIHFCKPSNSLYTSMWNADKKDAPYEPKSSRTVIQMMAVNGIFVVSVRLYSYHTKCRHNLSDEMDSGSIYSEVEWLLLKTASMQMLHASCKPSDREASKPNIPINTKYDTFQTFLPFILHHERLQRRAEIVMQGTWWCKHIH